LYGQTLGIVNLTPARYHAPMILDRYLVKQFLPIFVIVALMAVLLMLLIDLFANLVNYLNNDARGMDILRVSLYYLPKSFSYALPVALLFASAYTLGNLYARNELTSIFASGVPLWRFAAPLVVIGMTASLFAFFFDDAVVIPTLKLKTDLQMALKKQQRTEANSDIVIIARGGALIYSVDYFDRAVPALNGVSIVEQDEAGRLRSLIRAPRAVWNGDYWELSNPVIYEWEGDALVERPLGPTDAYREQPDAFGRTMSDVEELPAREAGLLVNDLRAAGLPFTQAQADYYHRFSFPTASLVVMVLSISMGGRFKKNILLMSLLSSICVAVAFYVLEMVTMLMARLGYIPTIAGAWFPVIVFILIGAALLRYAKT